jgi:regulator of protease activity HflC (stomatin/prohibitin superfamily)
MAVSENTKSATRSEEKPARTGNGMAALTLISVGMLAAVAGAIYGGIRLEAGRALALNLGLMGGGILYLSLIGPVLYLGLKVLRPNEALVLTLFGTYIGTVRGQGFFWVNPFSAAAAPATLKPSTGTIAETTPGAAAAPAQNPLAALSMKKISLKTLTLSNDRQKVNDALGNPIIIGIVVVWRVIDTAKAVFDVDNFYEYLSIQCDSALRNVVRLYPYDAADAEGEKSLRGSSQEIADKLKAEIQAKAGLAGLEIMEARITHLSYAPEIAAVMLQRQQASAIIAARQMIVDGAVGMVEMALAKLSAKKIVDLDEERKAAMVSNLLVVLCGNKEAQPVVNSGSIY